MAHWLLQANPQRWRIDDFFRENPASALDAWSITRYLDKVAAGDDIALWRAGPDAGVVALGQVTGPPFEHAGGADDYWEDHQKADRTRWSLPVRLSEVFTDAPVARDELRYDPQFAQAAEARGVQVIVAAQSVEGLGDHRQAPRLLASCAGGIVVQQCPDPERLLALAGQVRVLEHNWELDFYGPRGLAKARMGERPRIDPEQVRQAQPGEAWVIQAGQSLHLRVLPPPAVSPAPVEPTATLPLTDDTLPLPVVEQPAPVGIAAAVALASRIVRQAGQQIGRRRERAGRLPSPARRPWLVGRPLPGRSRR